MEVASSEARPNVGEPDLVFLPNGCPTDVWPYLLPHETDCDKFYYCEYGVKWELPSECDHGKHFDYILQECMDISLSRCQVGGDTETDANTCPPDWSVHDLIPHESDCDKFYFCNSGFLVQRECPPGMHFNVTVQACIQESLSNCQSDDETTEETITPGLTTTYEPNATPDPTTLEPTTLETTTPEPTTMTQPTTTQEPSTSEYTTQETTTSEPTTPEPTTTTQPTTTHEPSTSESTPRETTTLEPITSEPTTTLQPTTTRQPTTSESTTQETTTLEPITSEPTTSTQPTTTQEPSTSESTVQGTITFEPTTTSEFTTTPETITTEPIECPLDWSVHFLIPHETDCDKFYFCNSGFLEQRECPAGTHFNSTMQACIQESLSNCQQDENSIEETTTDTPQSTTTSVPTTTLEPSTTTIPTTTAQTTTTPGPTTTTTPEVTTTPEQTTTPEPTTTTEPTTTSEPTTTPEPTTTAEPTTNPEPTTTPESTATPDPTTTLQPTIPEPSTFEPISCQLDWSVHYLIQHESECDKFYFCNAGVLVERDCPIGTHFSPTAQACTSPNIANCPYKETTDEWLENGCPADWAVHHLLPHESNCEQFYYCNFGELALRDCAPGTHFNPSLQVCDHPENAGCENNGTSPETTTTSESSITTELITVTKTTTASQPSTTVISTVTDSETVTDLSTVTEPVTVTGIVTDTEPSNVTESITVTEPSTITEPVTITESSTVTGTVTVTVPSNITEPITVTELSTITEPVTATESSTVPVTVTESSTVTGTVTLTEPSNVTEPVTVTESSTVSGTVTVTEPSNVTEPITVTELSTITEPVTVTESSTVSGTVTVTEPSSVTEPHPIPDCAQGCIQLHWPHETDCEKYWHCRNGAAVLGVCSEGLLFNPDTETCDYSCNVACERAQVGIAMLQDGLKLYLPWNKVDDSLESFVTEKIGLLVEEINIALNNF